MSGYAFALSMHSQRTFNHELSTTRANAPGNISDGMTYLYLDDDQYGGGYWATVDRAAARHDTEFVMRADGVGQDKANPFARSA